MKFNNILSKIIEYGFYSLFLLVPLAFASDTSELFEFNKLWVTFSITIIIAFAWIGKMILNKQFKIQKTPLDIPILLFLASQIISTIFSIDRHVSLWGYYSRFNGGLYSIITYIFLYYAFITNLGTIKYVKRALKVSLVAGLIVSLWGLPSHFGYDPTCLLFRGTFDVSCWTNEFQPMVRIFSTLGQPDWMAAYLLILLPISTIQFLKSFKFEYNKNKLFISKKNLLISLYYLFITILFYADLMYTNSRSGGIAGFFIIFLICGVYFLHLYKNSVFKNKLHPLNLIPIFLLITFFLTTFLTSMPFTQLQPYTLNGILQKMAEKKTQKETPKAQVEKETSEPVHLGEMGGTDSKKIRLIVWEGAFNMWKANPLFGTGVETFAYAYYTYRPAAHNLTSEWNFLYNKAHNEFLNYLGTTGLFGLGTYLALIIVFLIKYVKVLKELHKNKRKEQFLVFALVCSFLTILITNFFGFSVVITNIYLFIIPAFAMIMLEKIETKKILAFPKNSIELGEKVKISNLSKILIVITAIIAFYFIVLLIRFWDADKSYAMGMNLNKARQYQEARPFLSKAIERRPGEPTFKDEYSINSSVLAVMFASQKDSTESAEIAKKLAQESAYITEFLTSAYPKNVVYWKSKVRVYYTLSQIDPQYIQFALQAIKKVSELAPTDANIFYNYGVISGQAGDVKKAVELLEKTVKLKPDYYDAHYALGIFYEQLATDENGKVVNGDYHQKAINQMKEILLKVVKNDKRAQEAISAWENK